MRTYTLMSQHPVLSLESLNTAEKTGKSLTSHFICNRCRQLSHSARSINTSLVADNGKNSDTIKLTNKVQPLHEQIIAERWENDRSSITGGLYHGPLLGSALPSTKN